MNDINKSDPKVTGLSDIIPLLKKKELKHFIRFLIKRNVSPSFEEFTAWTKGDKLKVKKTKKI